MMKSQGRVFDPPLASAWGIDNRKARVEGARAAGRLFHYPDERCCFRLMAEVKGSSQSTPLNKGGSKG